MNSTYLLFIIIVTQAAISGFYSGSSANDTVLQIDQAETVRVSLFELNPPGLIRLTAGSSDIIIYSKEAEITLSDLSVDLNLELSGGILYLETAGIHQPIDSLEIRSHSAPARVITDEFGYRYYSGRLHFKPNRNLSGISTINTADLEEYIASVVGSEMNFEEPDALKAQAVVSRTYALWSIARSPYPDFDMRDYESNQMYIGQIQGKPHYAEAARATRGEILTWSGQLILAVYSSTCGGATANNEEVWDGLPHPYLKSQQDGVMCSASPHYEWSYSVSRAQLRDIIRKQYGFSFVDQEFETTASGRVNRIFLKNSSGEAMQFSGNEFRLFLNEIFGPMAIRSTNFEWKEVAGTVTFSGKGLGHGVGMCQWGAKGFAEAGWAYKDILSFYFSGTKIVNLDSIQSNQLPLYP